MRVLLVLHVPGTLDIRTFVHLKYVCQNLIWLGNFKECFELSEYLGAQSIFSFETQNSVEFEILFLLWNTVILLTETQNSQESSGSTSVIGRNSLWFRDDQVPHQNGPIQTAWVIDQQCQFPLLDAPSASSEAN